MGKFNVSLDDELQKKLEDVAKRNYTTRSGFIAMAINKWLRDEETLQTMKKFTEWCRILADGEKFTDEQRKELEHLEFMINASMSNIN